MVDSQRTSLDNVGDASSPPRVLSRPRRSLAGLRLSIDSERSLSPSSGSANGIKHALNGTDHADGDDLDPLQRLQKELDRTKQEKEALAAQYQNLLTKLTTMRTTLGNKLKQDAVRPT